MHVVVSYIKLIYSLLLGHSEGQQNEQMFATHLAKEDAATQRDAGGQMTFSETLLAGHQHSTMTRRSLEATIHGSEKQAERQGRLLWAE